MADWMGQASRILFLPDFGQNVGGGHVMRCLTLASALSELGARCGFSVLPEAESLLATFGADVARVSDDWACDVAVVDGYHYSAADEAALRARAPKVAALDDLRRAHDCDLVVDSGIGRTAADYPGRARVLVGPAYAPVRREFAEHPWAPEAGRVLVSLGLTDVGGVTARVVELIRTMEGWSCLDVVLGSKAQSLPAIRALAQEDARVSVHVDARDMAALNARAAFVVGAGGGSTWERCSQGVPTLLLVLADNQLAGGEGLAARGAALTLDVREDAFDAAFGAAFTRLAGDRALRGAMSARAKALCDGGGARRIAEAIMAIASGGDSAAS